MLDQTTPHTSEANDTAVRTYDLVVVGADRIAANGDVANKIGTYTVAVGASSRDLRLSATVDLAGNERLQPLTPQSTVEEAMAFPGFADAMAAMVGDIALPQDEEMHRMMLSVPLSAVASFTGQTAEALQAMLDRLNAGAG